MAACPRCGDSVAANAKVCRHCLLVIDRAAWEHDAGRLEADNRGGGQPLEDPPVGPIPVTGVGLSAGVLGGALRLMSTALLLRRPRRR